MPNSSTNDERILPEAITYFNTYVFSQHRKAFFSLLWRKGVIVRTLSIWCLSCIIAQKRLIGSGSLVRSWPNDDQRIPFFTLCKKRIHYTDIKYISLFPERLSYLFRFLCITWLMQNSGLIPTITFLIRAICYPTINRLG